MRSSERMEIKSPIAGNVDGFIHDVCYNKHNNSFLIEYQPVDAEIWGLEIQIISLEIASIDGGQSPTSRLVFPGESSIIKWGFDIPFCRGMIHNYQEKKFKFCELKEYIPLFTIADLGFTQVGAHRQPGRPCFKSISPGNMDMVMYDTVSSTFNGILGVQLRIYSKLNGTLKKQMSIPELMSIPQMEFIALCGSNTLLMQGYLSEIQVVEMSSENPVSLIKRRNTKIRAACDPYYLCKRSQFICCNESQAILVCNLQGEILVTLEDHPFEVNLSFFVDSYISDSQEILISLCSRPAPSGSRSIYSVNASSIVTGECLATIT